MGIAFSCVAKDINVDRLAVDMTPLKNRNLPMVWISGQQNTGKRTHGDLIREKFDYDHINITDLLRQEAAKETERGDLVREAMSLKRKIPDDPDHILRFCLSGLTIPVYNTNYFLIDPQPDIVDMLRNKL